MRTTTEKLLGDIRAFLGVIMCFCAVIAGSTCGTP